MAAPISGEGLDPPAELLGGTADGAICATGPAMQQQVNRPASRALEQGRGDALLRPDEITATSGDDDDRAMGQRRRRQEAKGRQCSGLGHCSRGQAHGLQSKRTGQVVRGFRCRRRWARGLWRSSYSTSTNALGSGRAAAGQWIYAKQSHALMDREADKQTRQIQTWMPNRPRSRARKLGASPQPLPAGSGSATAAAGGQPCPPPPHRPRSGGRRRRADARHGAAVAR